jgi:hypothetical protein
MEEKSRVMAKRMRSVRRKLAGKNSRTLNMNHIRQIKIFPNHRDICLAHIPDIAIAARSSGKWSKHKAQ